MKNVAFSFFSITTIVMLLVYSSCKDDEITTENLRQQFLGVWTVADSCQSTPYQIDIIADTTNESYVYLHNFANTGKEASAAYGYVTENKISISRQSITTGIRVDGQIYINNDGSFNLDYAVESSAKDYGCLCKMVKQ